VIAGNWYLAIEDCDTIIAASKDKYELDLDADSGELCFNGPDEKRGHETFYVPRTITDIRDQIDRRTKEWPRDPQQWRWDFCKTNNKPYDDVVVACLCVLAETGLAVDSDGDKEEWEVGRKLAEKALGRPVQIPEKLREAV
jgi:hypothetical protein